MNIVLRCRTVYSITVASSIAFLLHFRFYLIFLLFTIIGHTSRLSRLAGPNEIHRRMSSCPIPQWEPGRIKNWMATAIQPFIAPRARIDSDDWLVHHRFQLGQLEPQLVVIVVKTFTLFQCFFAYQSRFLLVRHTRFYLNFDPLIQSSHCTTRGAYYSKIREPSPTCKLLEDKNQALFPDGEPNTEYLFGTFVDNDPRMGFICVHLLTMIWLDGTIRHSFAFKVQPPKLNWCAAEIDERDLRREFRIQRTKVGFVSCMNGVQRNLSSIVICQF